MVINAHTHTHTLAVNIKLQRNPILLVWSSEMGKTKFRNNKKLEAIKPKKNVVLSDAKIGKAVT